METHIDDIPRRLRERPPPWPRRSHRDRGRPPWQREPEPFEDGAVAELYPGALVMDDLVATDDETAALRVLARYTVARLLLLSLSGELAGPALRAERTVVLQHLALLPAFDWERRGLERLADLCSNEPGLDLIDAATTAAEAAAKRSRVMGAFTLYRAAYELCLEREWWAEAAQIARGVAQLARLQDASYSIRLWRRRAAVLDARAARAEEAAATEGAADAGGAAHGSAGGDPAGGRSESSGGGAKPRRHRRGTKPDRPGEGAGVP